MRLNARFYDRPRDARLVRATVQNADDKTVRTIARSTADVRETVGNCSSAVDVRNAAARKIKMRLAHRN